MGKEAILKQYEELKRNKKIINAIALDFFFEIVDYLLKENEELKEKNKKMCNKYCPFVQKIKDRIEELEKEKKKMGNGVVEIYEKDLVNVDIEFLQNLIEEREEK